MEAKFTPGPWEYENIPGKDRHGNARHLHRIAQAETNIFIVSMEEHYPQDNANARLIAASPTMFGKLADTVAWLDREIEDLRDCSPDYFRAAQIERLEELRDDLAETLRKIQS